MSLGDKERSVVYFKQKKWSMNMEAYSVLFAEQGGEAHFWIKKQLRSDSSMKDPCLHLSRQIIMSYDW